MKTTIFNITWAAAQNVFFAPFFIGVLFLVLWRFVRVRSAINKLASSSRAASLLRNVSIDQHVVKVALMTIGMAALFLALLRPQWGKRDHVVKQEGRDLFIAFDISRSMLAQDCKPSRLICAKKKVKELLNNLECERVGLILFSGSTVIQCPLTSDYDAFFMFLDQLDVETISSGTTAIDQAIKKAIEAFGSSVDRKNKLLVMLTDGEDFSSNLAGVRAKAAKEGLTIFAIGVGTPDGAPIPLFNKDGQASGHQKDKKGKVIITRLNEGILHNLAQQTGGKYLRMTSDDSDIKILTRLVKTFEKERFDDKEVSELQEKYPYFVAVSFVCFALEWLL